MRAIETRIRAFAVPAAAALMTAAATLTLAAAATAVTAPQAAAQTANRVDAKKDWSVFTAGSSPSRPGPRPSAAASRCRSSAGTST